MTSRTEDLMSRRGSAGFVGRARELEQLLAILSDAGPRVAYVHGIAGVGKSALLDAFSVRADAEGATVLRLDCREIEPTERGFLHELERATGTKATEQKHILTRLGALGPRVVVVLDTYEVFRVLDMWLRRSFVPALSDNVRVVVAGRDAPVAAWSSPGWHGLFVSLALGPLSEDESTQLLSALGLGATVARRINRFVRGHPLSLTVAASAVAVQPTLDLEDAAVQPVFDELARIYLSDLDRRTRRALDAASVVRRTTVSLLHAMLSDVDADEVFERLRSLPFVEARRDGLVLHETMQEAISASLKSADPSSHGRYRRAAWQQLRSEVATAGSPELWRYTPDMLYLVENAVVREAFFPSGAHLLSVEPAQPEDGIPMIDIAALHEPDGAVALLREWWTRHAEHFRAVRDQSGDLVGFYLMFDPQTVDTGLLRRDPITTLFTDDLRRRAIPRTQRALFHRRRLGREDGEGSGPVQAACYLDMKRVYMEMRPDLRRVYTARSGRVPPAQDALGFRPLENSPAVIDGVTYHATCLDFGPSSVDGWLTWLAGKELGIDEDDVLDAGARELVVDRKRVSLTTLEFGVFEYLLTREGKAVSRAALLQDVWGYDYEGGSNVVDAVIRSLRRKLGRRSDLIETVRGTGYRLKRR
jgi:hypothetical protein